MKRLVEEADPRVAEGMARLAQKDADIAALKQQIAKLEDEKADIQSELAKIQGQTGEQSDQDQQNTEEMVQKAAAAAAAAVSGQTSESLIEKINEQARDDEDMIRDEMEELEDELAHLQLQEDPANEEKIQAIISELEHYADVLARMELDQQEHEAEYEEDYWVDPAGGRHYDYGGDDDDFYDPASMYESEDEELEEKSDGPCWKGYEMVGMKEKGGKKVPNCVPKNESLDEGYASEFRPGRMIWKGKEHRIDKVENVNDRMDIVYVAGKMLSSTHLQNDGAKMVPKERKQRPKRMTKREYESTLKGAMSDLASDQGEIDHSMVYDTAESLIYDPELREYLTRMWKRDNGYDQWYDPEPTQRDLIELLTNELEMHESYNPAAKKNFYELKETYAEIVNQEEKKPVEEYIDEDFVFYVKVNDDGNEFIGKIFKVRPDGDWFGLVKKGDSDTFQKISYEPDYDEIDIVKFLGENYDKVEIIDRHEYNEFIENEEEIDEDIIGGSNWTTNSIASS